MRYFHAIYFAWQSVAARLNSASPASSGFGWGEIALLKFGVM
jgi:hypothetical protein